MKIAQIIYTGFGGLGSVAFSLVAADQERRHQWIIGFSGDQPLDSSYPDLCAQHGVDYEVFRSTPGRPYKAWWATAKWLAREKPDVVICHSINSVLACRWYASRHGAVLIAVEHTANQIKSRREWAASKVSMLVADRVVLLTSEYATELAQTHGFIYKSGKVCIIPNGVDTQLFRPQMRFDGEQVANTLHLGMAARFSHSKRQDMLINVLERLKELKPEWRICLHFAGDGPEYERVRQLAQHSKVCDCIVFDGLLNEMQIAGWLQKLDVYVHATDAETLSTSLLQAMSSGLPIIASDVPGVRNLLGQDRQWGHCVPNTPERFAQRILEDLQNPEQAGGRGQAARQRAVHHYDHRVMLSRYEGAIAVAWDAKTGRIQI